VWIARAFENGRDYVVTDLFARRAGLMLGRLAWRIGVSLGDVGPGPFDPAALDRTATDRLRDLPAFVAELGRLGDHENTYGKLV